MEKILAGQTSASFEEIIDEMITDAWYMVEGRLYAPDLSKDEFRNRLSEIVLPVYQSAKSAGFREWEYTG